MRKPDYKPDGQLLKAFAEAGDESAFAEIVRRHGPLVLNVCQRILGSTADAEDACQAAFLALARKAPRGRAFRSAGAWLHRVARNIALNALKSRKARESREEEVAEMMRHTESPATLSDEQRTLLHEEIDALPRKYREAIVLHHLQGKSLGEAATVLACPRKTLGTRVARARDRLRNRLSRRGLALSVAMLASSLSAEAGAVQFPAAFVASTTSAASLFLAGQSGAATGAAALSSRVASMAEGILTNMLYAKSQTVVLSLVLLACILGGTGWVITRDTGGDAEDAGSAAVAASAGAPGARAESPGKTLQLTGTDLFPLTKGSIWTYALRNAKPDTTPEHRYVAHDVIEGVCTELRGERGKLSHNEYWSSREDGIYRFHAKSGGPAGKAEGVDTSKEPSRILACPPREGATWEWTYTPATPSPGEERRVSCAALIESVDEEVVVPAGEFTTVRVKITSRVDGPDRSPDVETFWFASGVGIVKKLRTTGDGDAPTLALELTRSGRIVSAVDHDRIVRETPAGPEGDYRLKDELALEHAGWLFHLTPPRDVLGWEQGEMEPNWIIDHVHTKVNWREISLVEIDSEAGPRIALELIGEKQGALETRRRYVDLFTGKDITRESPNAQPQDNVGDVF